MILLQNAKGQRKEHLCAEEEEVIEIEDDGQEEDLVGHGVINLIEVKHHVQRLDEALQSMMLKLSSSEIKDILKNTIKEFQEPMTILIPSMSEADPIVVFRTIKDPMCLAYTHRWKKWRVSWRNSCQMKIHPRAPRLEGVEDIKPLSSNQDILIELFNDLQEAHDQMARVCGKLSMLAKGLTPSQLMLVMKSTIRPMIQLNIPLKHF